MRQAHGGHALDQFGHAGAGQRDVMDRAGDRAGLDCAVERRGQSTELM